MVFTYVVSEVDPTTGLFRDVIKEISSPAVGSPWDESVELRAEDPRAFVLPGELTLRLLIYMGAYGYNEHILATWEGFLLSDDGWVLIRGEVDPLGAVSYFTEPLELSLSAQGVV